MSLTYTSCKACARNGGGWDIIPLWRVRVRLKGLERRARDIGSHTSHDPNNAHGADRITDTRIPSLQRWEYVKADTPRTAEEQPAPAPRAAIEGGDIMLFHRWEAARKRHAEQVAQARDEGRNEGFAQGRDAVQQEWTAWNARRLEAETKGHPFNEPPPHSPQQP